MSSKLVPADRTVDRFIHSPQGDLDMITRPRQGLKGSEGALRIPFPACLV